MKKLVILGSTGSIGTQTLSVVEHLKDDFQIVGLAAEGSNESLLEQQILCWKPLIVSVNRYEVFQRLRARFPNIEWVFGDQGIREVAVFDSADLVVLAVPGLAALSPCIAALRAKKNVALASKEVLVAAGEFVMSEATRNGVSLIPIDSEHSGIFQCLEQRDKKDVRRIVLTASGGPLYRMSMDELRSVSIEKVLKHPVWSMGKKVTVDSSTLVNKGLEIIEAYWLFGFDVSSIDAIVHPQSVIHGLIELIDGSVIAQMSKPSMIYPIQYALTWPKRSSGMFHVFDFLKHGTLEFFPLDDVKFPSIALAKEVLKLKKSFACCYNAANEILVQRFLNEEIGWIDISEKLCDIVISHKPHDISSIEDVIEVDRNVRQEAVTK
ncbi:MAG: 1-deoxy-D-xylulose-5-phosphate reductoisomerase [Victivallaceae bacterium]